MYAVVYTKHITQKAKTWMDGTLKQSGRKFSLRDEEGTTVETAFLRPSDVVVGETVRSERHLIQILSATTNGDTPTPAPNDAPPRGSVIIPKSSAAPKVRRNPLASSLRRTGKSLGARPTIKKQKATTSQSRSFLDDSDIADQAAAEAAAAAEEAYHAQRAAPPSEGVNRSEGRMNSPPEAFRSASAAYAEQRASGGEERSPVLSYSSSASCSGECPERLPPPPPGGRSRQSIVAHLEGE